MQSQTDHPFLRPLWRRVAIVAFCSGWSLFEWIYVGDAFWGTLTAAVAAYAAWIYLWTYRPPEAAAPGRDA